MAKALVYKATSDDHKDPTGFVLKELANESYVSLKSCSELVEHLIARVAKDKPDVKFKALRCIKYLCLNGRTEFRLEVQRENQAIKECLQFKGAPDPLRGDAPFQRVRDEARDCLAAMYNGPTTTQAHAATAGRIEGYGSSISSTATPSSSSTSSSSASTSTSTPSHDFNGTYSTPSMPANYAGANTNSKYVGYGNPAFENDKDNGFLSKVKSKLSGEKEGVQRPTFKPYDRSASYAPEFQTPPPATLNDGNSQRKRGEVGGIWANEPSSSTVSSSSSSASSSSSVSNSYTTSAPSVTTSTATISNRTVSRSNGEFETRLVDSLTTASGVRGEVPADELKKFLLQSESLDKFLLAQIINAKLAVGQPPISQMKALSLFEALLARSEGCEEIEDYLHENPSNIESLEHAQHPQVRTKAVKVMQLAALREETKPAPKPQPTFHAHTNTAPTSNNTATSSNVDLLGFASSPSPATTTPANDSAFGFLSSPAPAASPASSSSVNDTTNLFGQLEIKSTPAPSSSTNSLDPLDIFSSTSTSTSSSSATPSKATPSPAPSTTASTTSSTDPFAILNNPSLAGPKVDPVTALLNNTKAASLVASASAAQRNAGMSSLPNYAANPVPLGPPVRPVAYGAYPPQGGYAPQGYPQVGYPAQNGGFGAPPLSIPPSSQSSSVNPGALNFQVKAANSNGSSLGPSAPRSSAPPGVDPFAQAANPQGNTNSQPSTTSGFGFLEGSNDSFGFVNDMLKS